MVEKDKLFESNVKHVGIWDFKETYRTLYEWLLNEGYDVNEKTYKEILGPGGEKEIEIEWKAYRKISDYFRFVIEVDWHIMRMTSVEAEIEGVKRKMNKGRIEVKIKTILEKDYEARWEGKAFFKFLRTMYDRYLVPARIESYEEKLIGEGDELVAQLKAYLELVGKK